MMKATEAHAIAITYARVHAVELVTEADAQIRRMAEAGKFYTYYSNGDFMNPYVRDAFQELLESYGYKLTYTINSRSFCIEWEKND